MPRSRPGAFGLRRALVEAVPIGKLLRARQRACEIARIVDLPGRRLVRQRFRLDEILAAYRIGRDVEIVRRRIDNTLDQIGRFRPSGAAIGVDRNRVGVGRAQPDVRNRNVVGAGRHADAEPRDVGRIARQIGAHVGDDVELEREETSLLVDRQPRGGDIVAAVAVAEEMLGAIANPFDRAAQPFSRNRGQRIFAIRKQLGAEAAADVRRDHPHLFGRQLHHRAADDVADDMAALAAERERIALAVVFGDHAAGIEIIGHQPLIDDRQFDNTRGLGESLLGGARVANLGLEREIVRPLCPDLAARRV